MSLLLNYVPSFVFQPVTTEERQKYHETASVNLLKVHLSGLIVNEWELYEFSFLNGVLRMAIIFAWGLCYIILQTEDVRFAAGGSRCRQNLKVEHFMLLFGRQRQKIAPKRVAHVQHDYFSPFNQSYH